MQNYKVAAEQFKKGNYQTVADILALGKAKDHRIAVGHVKNILNENFGIIQFGDDLALFDTFDFFLADNKTASEANKSVGACVGVNQKVEGNACLVNPDLPITHLATSVWVYGNKKIVEKERPLELSQIAPEKLAIYEQVSKSCAKLVAKRKATIDEVKESPKYK